MWTTRRFLSVTKWYEGPSLVPQGVLSNLVMVKSRQMLIKLLTGVPSSQSHQSEEEQIGRRRGHSRLPFAHHQCWQRERGFMGNLGRIYIDLPSPSPTWLVPFRRRLGIEEHERQRAFAAWMALRQSLLVRYILVDHVPPDLQIRLAAYCLVATAAVNPMTVSDLGGSLYDAAKYIIDKEFRTENDSRYSNKKQKLSNDLSAPSSPPSSSTSHNPTSIKQKINAVASSSTSMSTSMSTSTSASTSASTTRKPISIGQNNNAVASSSSSVIEKKLSHQK
ncbi:hypothetical protein BDC45DRAFT_572411 [Circinella umbellata]|nr:hypothetical protein BDC45DRAFT_572411 [Circinella umbellata]